MGSPLTFYRFMDSVGDGSGTKNMGVAADTYYLTPQGVDIMVCERAIISMVDALITAAKYAGITALTTGITLQVERATVQILDLMNGVPVKNTAGWTRQCYDGNQQAFGSGDDTYSARWTFGKAGFPIVLDGSKSDRLALVVPDALTGITAHYVQIQGFYANRKM